MTAQVREHIIIEGTLSSMATCPGIKEIPGKTIKLKEPPATDNFLIYSTACWRQYIGTWEIKEDKLYLVDVEGIYQKLSPIPIFAKWFSGTLVLEKGEILKYIHMGFESIYESEIHIRVRSGRVKGKKIVDNYRP